MARFAQFDPSAPAPQPIVGWYDTDVFAYPNLPPESALIEVTDLQWDARLADPSGWVNDGGSVAAAPTPTPSLADQAAALLAAGLVVTSTGTPARTAIYPCDDTTMQEVTSQLVSILSNGTFADGTDAVSWPDIHGDEHAFDIGSFKALAAKLSAFVQPLLRIIRTNAGTLPSDEATIA